MMAPINKQFFDEVEARISNITINNGYNHDVGRIARARLKPFKGYDLPAVNIWASDLGNSITSYGDDARELSLYVEMHNKTSDEPFIDICDLMAQDLIIALNRATANPTVSDDESPDLGGSCEDFIFIGYDYQVGQGQEPFCAILARFVVKYTVNQNVL